jgi:MFS family permease
VIFLDITKDKNIWKFSFYGFFKNLKFFEPFLYVYFLSIGLSYFQIGTLISIRELVKNIIEIPSGIFADNYGRKSSMKICFIFYIISFIIFYLGLNFINMIFAMVFFGFGEAFRSGTHKAIIFTYLDYKNISNKKVEVYGRTKSFSLIGSSFSAILGATIVFIESGYRSIFLLSIIPYIIDFILISSYPDYLDKTKEKNLNFSEIIKGVKNSFQNIKNITHLKIGLINSGIYDGYFKVLKDYLQPILKTQLAVISIGYMFSTEEKMLSIFLGISYFIINIITSFTTKNSYRLKKYFESSSKVLNSIFIFTTIIIAMIGLLYWNNIPIIIIFLYLIYYIIRNARRPFMLDYLSRVIKEEERATVLSIENQLRTIIIMILAPLLGLIADYFGLWIMFETAFVTLSLLYLLINLSDFD